MRRYTQPLSTTDATHQNHVLAGALCMCIAMAGGASIDVAAKSLAPDYSTAQIVLLRSAFAVPLVFAIVWHQVGLSALLNAGWKWQLWRGLLTAGANFGFFYGLGFVPLVTALMLAYVSPVLIVLLAKPMLGESLSLRRLGGVLIGFVGVLVVIDPFSTLATQNTDSAWIVEPGVLAILGSAVCWALLSISNRQLAPSVSAPVLTFYTYPVALVLAAVLTIDNWVMPVGWDWGLFAMAGIGSVLAHGFAALAYRYAAAGVVAPFEYTALIWLSLAGYFLFDEVPSEAVWIGGVAVILGGYIALQARD